MYELYNWYTAAPGLYELYNWYTVAPGLYELYNWYGSGPDLYELYNWYICPWNDPHLTRVRSSWATAASSNSASRRVGGARRHSAGSGPGAWSGACGCRQT